MAGKLVKNLRSEYLSCSICLEQYKDPKRLPCEHIFCKDCLTNHVTKNFNTRHFHSFVTCPLCRTEFEGVSQDSKVFIPHEWVNNLPTDSLVTSLIQTLQLHDKERLSEFRHQYGCSVHSGKSRDAFCLTHVQLVCWECAARQHKICQVDSIDKALPRVQGEIENLRDLVSQQLSLALELSKSDKVFDDNKSKALHELERAKLQFEKVKTSIESQFRLIEKEIDSCTSARLQQRKDFYSLVASVLEHKCILETSLEDEDAAVILEAYGILSKATEDRSKLLDKFKANHSESLVKFVKDPLFQGFISKFGSIGFVETDLVSSKDGYRGSVKTPISSLPSSIAHILNRNKTPLASNVTTKKNFQHMQDIDAMMDKEDTCFVNGIVSFSGSVIYVIDSENEKVKEFDLDGKLLDVLQLSGPPHDITCLQPFQELGITQPDEKLIAIVSANGLVHKRYIQTGVPYNGICQFNEETIALSSWSVLCVDIMSLIHGRVLYHISKDAHDLKCDLPNLLCKLSNDRIVITELGNTIICIKSSHHPPQGAAVQWMHTAPARIYGVCADDKEFIYACVKDRNEIRMIRDDGDLCENAVLSDKDGINQPMSIYYSNGYLFVADDRRIKVFKT